MYHRQCSQCFTANLSLLKDATRPSTSHSPHKAVDKSSQLFPPECMFPEHLEAKLTRKPKDPSSSFPNPDYRNKKLMKPLQNHEISDKILFYLLHIAIFVSRFLTIWPPRRILSSQQTTINPTQSRPREDEAGFI